MRHGLTKQLGSPNGPADYAPTPAPAISCKTWQTPVLRTESLAQIPSAGEGSPGGQGGAAEAHRQQRPCLSPAPVAPRRSRPGPTVASFLGAIFPSATSQGAGCPAGPSDRTDADRHSSRLGCIRPTPPQYLRPPPHPPLPSLTHPQLLLRLDIARFPQTLLGDAVATAPTRRLLDTLAAAVARTQSMYRPLRPPPTLPPQRDRTGLHPHDALNAFDVSIAVRASPHDFSSRSATSPRAL